MRLLNALVEYASDAIIVTNLDAVIQYVNPAFCQITGYSAKEVLGHKPSRLKSGWHSAEFYQKFWQALANEGRWQDEIWNRRKNGEVYLCWLSVVVITDQHGKPASYLGVASDMPQRQPDPALARYTAGNYDALTRLPNRFLLDDKMILAQALAKRHQLRYAVMCLELDGLRPVNELLGRPVGDKLLREVADRLRNRVREIDTVARVDAERFVIVLTEIKSMDDISQLGRTILRWLEMPFSIERNTVAVSPSLGIAVYPDDHTERAELLRLAAEAVQRAKAAGKGHFCFYNPQAPPSGE